MDNKKPAQLNILGINYNIEYCDNPANVDIFKREAMWGQIDYWTKTIRIYDNNRSIEDIWETIIHEVLHAIGGALKLDILGRGTGADEQKHDELDILALAITDTLIRNKLLRIE